MNDVFISYSQRDQSIASSVADHLARAGFEVWWDRSLVGGEDFRSEIDRQLKSSRNVVVIWTIHSIKSRWVHGEADEAVGVDRLIPIIQEPLDRSDIPLGFRHLHTISISQTAQLIEALQRKADDCESIGSLVAKSKPGMFGRVFRDPLLYFALTGAFVAYVVFPGFVTGIAIGLAVALLMVFWLNS